MSDNYAVRDATGTVIDKASSQLTGGAHADKAVLIKADGTPVDPATQTTLAAVLAAAQALAPASGAISVTPSDSTTLSNVRAVFVGTGGDVVATIGGSDYTFANVPDGTTLPIKATKIKAATTASDIVALT